MILERIAHYCRDLLTFPEERIVIGRLNVEIQRKSEDWITLDYLTSKAIAKGESFDGENEEMLYGVLTDWRTSITFTGDNALENITRLEALILSDLSVNLQKDLAIRVNNFTNIHNLKWLSGNIWDETYQGMLKTTAYMDTPVKTRRIDIAQIATRTDLTTSI